MQGIKALQIETLIERFGGPLTGLLAAWGVPYSEAIELAQDSFTDAYLSRQDCRGDCDDPRVFGRWLHGVAKNRFRNWVRSKKRRLRVLTIEPSTLANVESSSEASSSDDAEKLQQLRAAIACLSIKHRQVVLMYYLDETPTRDVAHLLGLSERAVEGRLYQARRKLKQMLEDKPSFAMHVHIKACWL